MPKIWDAPAGQVSYNVALRAVSLIVTAPLAANTTYTARITTAATDASGNPLADAYRWSFTIGTQTIAIDASNRAGNTNGSFTFPNSLLVTSPV